MLQNSGQMPSWTRQMESSQHHHAEVERLNALKDAEALAATLVDEGEATNDESIS
jgi:hypothetical protein